MLIPLDTSYLDTILNWRNQEDVRKFSFNDHIISKKEHYHWWDSIKNDASKQWMISLYENSPIGVVNYYDIKDEDEAYWGFYLANDIEDEKKLKYWIGIEKEAIDYAFANLNLKKLKCEIFRFNKAALFMHKRTGYQEIDTYQHEKGEVVVLELQRSRVKHDGR